MMIEILNKNFMYVGMLIKELASLVKLILFLKFLFFFIEKNNNNSKLKNSVHI